MKGENIVKNLLIKISLTLSIASLIISMVISLWLLPDYFDLKKEIIVVASENDALRLKQSDDIYQTRSIPVQ